MARKVEVRNEGGLWSVYAEDKLLQDGFPTEEQALKVAAAVKEVVEPFEGWKATSTETPG